MFSEKFKQLRKNKDLTQDQIADIFYVSPKCVSRWETGTNFPDVELLPHIAIYFNVTLDELLGTDEIRDEKKIGELSHNIRRLLEVGKVYDAIDAARKARKEYPLNNAFSFELLQALRTACSEKTPGYKENTEKFKDEIIEVAERVIASKEYKPSLWFRIELIRNYADWGMKEEAKKLLDTLPNEIWDTKEPWSGLVLDGEEWRRNQEALMCRFTVLLNYAISQYAHRADLDVLKKIEWLKKEMQIESFMDTLYGGNEADLITISEGRARQNIVIAELYCEAGDIENALDYIEKATQDAVYYCSNMEKKAFHGYDINTTPRNLCWIMCEDSLM